MFHCLVNSEYGACNPNKLWTTSWESGLQTYLLAEVKSKRRLHTRCCCRYPVKTGTQETQWGVSF